MPDINDKTAQRPWLKAYSLGAVDDWAIEAASPKRDWMDETFKKIAYRCLPLIAANQMGWVVRCPANLTATWSGKPDNHGVRIAYEADSAHLAGIAISHFGGGVLTFVLPWLFRTSPGFGLVLRGPTNESKDHAFPLDAVIETDWSPYTFTMNWRLSIPKYRCALAKAMPFACCSRTHLRCSSSSIVPSSRLRMRRRRFSAASMTSSRAERGTSKGLRKANTRRSATTLQAAIRTALRRVIREAPSRHR
jgi:hypothetical protein